MTSHRPVIQRTVLAVAFVLALSAGGPAAAELPPPPGPVSLCLWQCTSLHRQCARGCNAALADCMGGAKLEMRVCRGECTAQFEEETPELESCLVTCREEILAPAREVCFPERRQCAELCSPGACVEICRPDGGGIDELDECRAACGVELRECARRVRRALRECLAPCWEITDEAERKTCAVACAEAARGSASVCLEGLRSCSTACEAATTTTTVPEP